MIDLHLLNKISHLITLPLLNKFYFLSGTEIYLKKIETNNPWLQDKLKQETFLFDIWQQQQLEKPHIGQSLNWTAHIFNMIWGCDAKIALGEFYLNLAKIYLDVDGDRFVLSPKLEQLFNLGLEQLDALQLWHLINSKLGPDILPALLASNKNYQSRNRLIKNGLVVDSAGNNLLGNLLDQGLRDCHLHSGSAIRSDKVWPNFIESLENNYETLINSLQDTPYMGFKNFLQDIPLFLMAALVRRVLNLVISNNYFEIKEIFKLIKNGLLIWEQDRFWEHRIAFLLISKLESYQALYLYREYTIVNEAELLTTQLNTTDQNIEVLLWFYIRIKGIFQRHFIQEPALEGLDFFRSIYNQSRLLKSLRKKIHQQPDLLAQNLSPFNRVNHVEIRTSPEAEDVYALLELSQYAHQAKSSVQVSTIAHFVKKQPLTNFALDNLELHGQLKELQQLMDMFHYKGLPYFFTGIDVAGPELNRPNWFYLPVFIEMRPWWQHRFMHKLGYTYHAGEDFHHLIQGLRHISEIVHYFPWQTGDRIGHGLALAMDVEKWHKKHSIILSPIDMQLFDLIWENSLYKNHYIKINYVLQKDIDQQIEILGTEFLQALHCYPQRLSVQQWDLFYQGLFCPYLLLKILHEPLYWQGSPSYRQKICQKVNQDPIVKQLLKCYLLQIGKKEMPEYQYLLREQEVARIKAIQQWLIKTLQQKHIAIEACPSSNLTIRGIPTLLEHPLLNLMDSLPIIVNTDNPLTFATDLVQEMSFIYYAELAKNKNGQQALQKLEQLMKNAEYFKF